MISTILHYTGLNISVVLLALCCCLQPSNALTQVASDLETLQSVAPSRSWEMKVVWQDVRGVKHKTRGWLLLVADDALVLSIESGYGRAIQQKIHASNIIKVKYKERGASALPDVATGALQGALSGGYVPIQTGNLSLDLLAGAVQGALGGLFQGNSYSRRIYVDQRTDVFREYVYPELAAGR